jgi:hypothetical protein
MLLPIFGGGIFTSTPIEEDKGETARRLLKRCGIPENVVWNNKTRLVYGKQIEKVIKEMN